MYEEATTISAAGDREAANDAVTWPFTRQRANPRSAFAAGVRLRLKRPKTVLYNILIQCDLCMGYSNITQIHALFTKTLENSDTCD
jgi:hypothetical protein